MKYPNFLKEHDTIGITAPSFGVSGTPYVERFANLNNKFKEFNLNLKYGQYIHGITLAQSTTKEKRAQDFMQMYMSEDASFILSMAGGERMLEILPYIDFELIKKTTPKFFMGYSDNTVLTYTLTTICDIATIYGICAGDFGIQTYDKCRQDTLSLMMNQKLKHHAYPLIELEDLKKEQPLSGYNAIHPNVWKNLNNEKGIELKGRLIGGCLDVLVNICGTKFDQTTAFCEKYQNDGIVFFLEVCDASPLSVLRGLTQLKWAGWFKHATGFIFGRPNNDIADFDFTHPMAINEALNELNVPIIIDMDLGHVSPTFPIICGSLTHIVNNENESTIEYILK